MDPKIKFMLAHNFVLYYGSGQEDELKAFDLAIIESKGQSPVSLNNLHLAGTITLAYLSIIELPGYDPDFGLLYPKEQLMINGKPLKNSSYDTYWLDIRSQNWQNILISRAEYLIDRLGYDGLFLDTIGNVEDPRLPDKLSHSLMLAATNFVRRLRDMFPRALFIQNNGFEQLFTLTSPYVDGFCWENPPFADPSGQGWIERIKHNLQKVNRYYGLRTFLLLEEPSTNSVDFACESKSTNPAWFRTVNKARQTAAEMDALLYIAPKGYVSGVKKEETKYYSSLLSPKSI